MEITAIQLVIIVLLGTITISIPISLLGIIYALHSIRNTLADIDESIIGIKHLLADRNNKK